MTNSRFDTINIVKGLNISEWVMTSKSANLFNNIISLRLFSWNAIFRIFRKCGCVNEVLKENGRL